MVRQPEGSGPKLIGVPMQVTAKVAVPGGGAEGVIFALGGDAGGWALFAWDGKIRYHYNYFGLERYDTVADAPLKPGDHTIVVDFQPDRPAPGCAATVKLYVDDAQVGETRVERQIPLRSGTECFDVRQDSRSPVCNDFNDRGVFGFTGTIAHVAFEFGDFDEPTGKDRLKMATKLDLSPSPVSHRLDSTSSMPAMAHGFELFS